MTFLPIVVRELRVASRKRRTFWLRVVAALVALVVGGCILLLSMAGAFSASDLGKALFGILSWMLLAVALTAGMFFTADSLSEEKREGTLGFLFLTDLRGYDVTGGKLLATSLRAFYALLAVFPILALTLTMGGVTGAAFWKTALALLNALFCSLTMGMFISSINRDSQRALTGTVFALFAWVAGGPIADAIIAARRDAPYAPYFSLSSPFYPFGAADAWGQTRYWTGMLVSQVIAWVLFAITSLLIQRAWQEKRPRSNASVSTFSYAWRFGNRGRRDKVRRKLVGINPVMWLVCRERWQAFGVWVIALLLIIPVTTLYLLKLSSEAVIAWSFGSQICVWVLYLWAASQSNRFFVEARRSGLLELLLATPLKVSDILLGQWRAFGRMFGAPVLLILAAGFFGAVMSETSSLTGPMRGQHNWLMTLAFAAIGSLSAIANIIALLWFGMWMGLTSKNFSLATLKTLGFVQVLPTMVISFASGIVAYLILLPALMKAANTTGTSGTINSAQIIGWFPLAMKGGACAMTIAKDIGFAIWSRNQLHKYFRHQASRSFNVAPAIRRRVPPPPPIVMPPLIPTQP